MNLEVLISCMHQKDGSIIKDTNITSDVLVINQCDSKDYQEFSISSKRKARIISNTERGLSRSRNMAIQNSLGDICLLVDDDEVLNEDYETNILEGFKQNPNADIIAFSLIYSNKKYSKKSYNVNYLSSLRIGSCQIAFRRKRIISKNIKFDTKFGSGSGNGPGEENLFLFECLKKKLKVIYLPITIGTVNQESSQWFNGFDNTYFFNRGKIIKELMGSFLAVCYAFEFAVVKYPKYKKETSFFNAIKLMVKGIRH